MPNPLHLISEINEAADKDYEDFVLQSEADFSSSVASLIDRILSNKNNKIIMLAGPSASGKTTCAKILTKAISAKGSHAYTVSLDDFYMDRFSVPKFDDGTPNFETVYALDLPLLSKCLNDILKNDCADIPVFDFVNGCRAEESNRLELKRDDIVIFEGLHALNPVITDCLPKENLAKVYISIASKIYDDDKNVLLTRRNLRFLRRAVRDYYYRNSSIENTCRLWENVQFGENKYLFPYKPLADYTVDSLHPYEPCLFKTAATALFQDLPEDSPYFEECQQIVSTLDKFTAIPENIIPQDSLLKEFIPKS